MSTVGQGSSPAKKTHHRAGPGPPPPGSQRVHGQHPGGGHRDQGQGDRAGRPNAWSGLRAGSPPSTKASRANGSTSTVRSSFRSQLAGAVRLTPGSAITDLYSQRNSLAAARPRTIAYAAITARCSGSGQAPFQASCIACTPAPSGVKSPMRLHARPASPRAAPTGRRRTSAGRTAACRCPLAALPLGATAAISRPIANSGRGGQDEGDQEPDGLLGQRRRRRRRRRRPITSGRPRQSAIARPMASWALEQPATGGPGWSTAGAGCPSPDRWPGSCGSTLRASMARTNADQDGHVQVDDPQAAEVGVRLAEGRDAADDHQQQRREGEGEEPPGRVAPEQLGLGQGQLGEPTHWEPLLSGCLAGGRLSRRRPVSATKASSRLACSIRSSAAMMWLRARTAVTACSRSPVPVTNDPGARAGSPRAPPAGR